MILGGNVCVCVRERKEDEEEKYWTNRWRHVPRVAENPLSSDGRAQVEGKLLRKRNEIYLRPKAIAKIITNTTTTAAIIPIMINNFFKGKTEARVRTRQANVVER